MRCELVLVCKLYCPVLGGRAERLLGGADGAWGGWVLQSKSGENGVWWTNKLKPAYQVPLELPSHLPLQSSATSMHAWEHAFARYCMHASSAVPNCLWASSHMEVFWPWAYQEKKKYREDDAVRHSI